MFPSLRNFLLASWNLFSSKCKQGIATWGAQSDDYQYDSIGGDNDVEKM